MKSFWIPFTGPKKLRKKKEKRRKQRNEGNIGRNEKDGRATPEKKKKKEHQETVAALNKRIEDLQGIVFNRFSQG